MTAVRSERHATPPDGPERHGLGLRFPPGFVWGAATAAYQIEGAAAEDGRTPSIWDTFSHTPGRVRNGDTGDIAADHYHRFRDDVALMRNLGLGAYRFSVSWSRVQPTGRGPAIQRGLDFYRKLVDELLAKGITPVATLYHWDLPQELEDVGGWTVRDTTERFAEYAGIMARRARRPGAVLDHAQRALVLGLSRLRLRGARPRAHGAGGRAARPRTTSTSPMAGRSGCCAPCSPLPRRPRSPSTCTRCARSATPPPTWTRPAGSTRSATGSSSGPILGDGYPADLLADTAHLVDWERWSSDGDLAEIPRPIDLLGLNYYTPTLVSDGRRTRRLRTVPRNDGHGASDHSPWPGSEHVAFHLAPGETTAMRWAVDAERPDDLLLRDPPGAPGPAADGHRERRGLRRLRLARGPGQRPASGSPTCAATCPAVHEARRQGADVRGYFLWSLLDNFEWAYGYSKRFGAVYVDFGTQRRIPRAARTGTPRWRARTSCQDSRRRTGSPEGTEKVRYGSSRVPSRRTALLPWGWAGMPRAGCGAAPARADQPVVRGERLGEGAVALRDRAAARVGPALRAAGALLVAGRGPHRQPRQALGLREAPRACRRRRRLKISAADVVDADHRGDRDLLPGRGVGEPEHALDLPLGGGGAVDRVLAHVAVEGGPVVHRHDVDGVDVHAVALGVRPAGRCRPG